MANADALRATPGSSTLSSTAEMSDLERWASLFGGGMLALYGISSRDSLCQVVCPILGGFLMYRGLSGSSSRERGPATAVPAGAGSRVDYTITVDRPAAELFQTWRQFDRLPRFMNHLQEVRITGPNRSHWVAKGPMGSTVEWDAEIINERENELIAWRSLPGSTVDTAGSVRFTPTRGNRATEVRVEIRYNPPGGKLGSSVAWLFGEAPEQQVREDLDRFKQMAESGQLAQTGQVAPQRARVTR